jgi:membrane carboxypeptidase/penicillin-binding protein PbpC
MLEVYFNIIEWGPNVYGIGEASHYYFQKTPAELNLNECLYLARIIPSPKKFMYQFNDQGKLRDFAQKQETFLTNIMIRRGLLSIDDTIYKSQPMIITGAAKSLLRLRVQDSTAVDTIVVKNEFEF